MSLLEEILENIDLITEDVDVASISDAINTMRPVYIKYNSGGKNKATGRRLIYPVAYGVSSAGNQVVRAFEEQGDTDSSVPAWKFFRVDRILWWRTVKDKNRSFKDKELVGLNKSGKDKGMVQIFTLSPLCGQLDKNNEPQIDAEPVTKDDVRQPSTDTKKRRLWSPKQIGRDIVNFFKNWKTKYQKEPEVKLDNNGDISYFKDNKINKITAPSSEPVTKAEINGTQARAETKTDNSEQELDKLRGDSGPVTRGDVEGENKEENTDDLQQTPIITTKFNDMMNRWNDIDNNETNS